MNQPVKQLSIRYIYVVLLAITAGITAMPAVGAQDRQDLATIHDAVIDFVTMQHGAEADLQVRPDAMDRRLRLAPCQGPLVAFWAPGSKAVGRTTVGVRCAGKRPWKLFIPTRVMLMQAVVVANRPLLSGQRIAAQDLRIEKRDVGSLRRAAIHDAAQILGYMVKRAMPVGQVVDATKLQAPILVERGRRVRMAVNARGVKISMSGQAMEDGALGETVKVRNTSSRAIVEGVVTGPGTVRLHLAATAIKTSLKQ